jgi:protein associated with RNAse G/E
MEDLTIIKKNAAGQEVWRYTGRTLKRKSRVVLLEAFFNRDDTQVGGIAMAKGDRFLETYFADRWYNIYEIHNPESGALRGWYSNVSRPASIQPGVIEYVDLALDLIVLPNGQMKVLDEDEFAELDLSDADREKALQALEDLKYLFKEHPYLSLERYFKSL